MDVPLGNGMQYSEVEISNGLEDVSIDEAHNYKSDTEVDGDLSSGDDAIGDDDEEVPSEPKGVPPEHDEEGCDWRNDSSTEDSGSEDRIIINGMVDILNLDVKYINAVDVDRFDFLDLDVAYQFYCWFARLSGFSVRKAQVLRGDAGEIQQQTFICSRAGYREDRGLTTEGRTRAQKNETRCGCQTKFRVHIHIITQRWYVTVCNFDHNHSLLEEKYCALLPAHRKMNKADILQIESFRKVGIRPPQIYGSFANTAGGYDKVRFVKKDIYNQIGKQRREASSDATAALKYLREIAKKDTQMFIRHTTDEDGRLKHLFWSDGDSRMSYKVFDDVLAFDATYKKNKYMCPFVVFSGVNHHNQTIVFATALVSNETEDTYVWLLEQLLTAMDGKAPVSVITDGDVAMKNAIKRVFPNAHHRLCAWHLLRNAMSNVGVPEFMPYLKKFMLGDHEVQKFDEIWTDMISKFGLEDNCWIQELYGKKKMWSTAHIRGNFFAGIRTTSRCEALHSHIGKFVHSRINLTEFVQQFHRCLTYFRFREVEADFQSEYGQAVLLTNLRSLERSGAKLFTKEIFVLFRKVLTKAALIRVTNCQDMAMFSIYSVAKYRSQGYVWQVSYCPSLVEFRCSCLRMESIGLSCDHIVAVLVYLDFSELPKCVVLDRWTKTAKDVIRGSDEDGSGYWSSQSVARYATLVHLSKEVSELAHRDVDDYNIQVEYLANELNRLKAKYGPPPEVTRETQPPEETLQDPPIVRTKGCGQSTTTTDGRRRRTQSCGACGASGHNRRACPTVRQNINGGDGPRSGDPSVEGTTDGGGQSQNTMQFQEQSQTFAASSSRAFADPA